MRFTLLSSVWRPWTATHIRVLVDQAKGGTLLLAIRETAEKTIFAKNRDTVETDILTTTVGRSEVAEAEVQWQAVTTVVVIVGALVIEDTTPKVETGCDIKGTLHDVMNQLRTEKRSRDESVTIGPAMMIMTDRGRQGHASTELWTTSGIVDSAVDTVSERTRLV